MPNKRAYSIILIFLRLPLLILWVIVLLVPALFIRIIRPHSRLATEKLPIVFHRGVSKIFGLRLKVSGDLSHHRPTLYICNHVSYLDIFLLGSLVPGYFIAKSEVASWPLFGKLARLQNTLFIERNSRRARTQVDTLQSQLLEGKNLILFPEGTSTEGTHVEPFKSSLFHAAEANSETAIEIQPMTLAYTRYRGKLMDQRLRDYYAWYSTMPFLSHFLQAMGMRSAEVELILHAPVQTNAFKSRKACAEYCWKTVNDALLSRIKTVSSKSCPHAKSTAPNQLNSANQHVP